VLGHAGGRTICTLERVAVGTHGLRREVGRRRIRAEERAEWPVHRGIGAPRFGGALAGGDFRGADGQAAGVDELAGERRGERRNGGLELVGHGAEAWPGVRTCPGIVLLEPIGG
jgi:hypothetical protein